MVARSINIYSFMLILLVALSLAACSSDDDENTNEAENQVNEESDAIDDTGGDEADDAGGDATDETGDAGGDATDETGDAGGDATDETGDAGGDATDETGDAGGDATDETGDAGGDATDDAGDDINDECDHLGFEPVSEDASLIPSWNVFTYLAQNTADAPVNTLNFDITTIPESGDIIELDDTNYVECDPCVTIWMGCDAGLGNCSKTFLVQEGEMTIDSIGESGDTFSGSVTDALFVEVDIDDEFESTPVVDGESWCLPNYEFSAEIQ